ncbi:hypothetical protein EJ04DRAFT_586287 [Polyplosphaeria fusca]|uniref:MYND-type domain-containing protein n=1 Tax=Polyplosphaeria fusca TaxID=682080 RepID=A0A9P4QN52_9PLEO|nr:hypothetical protein EJ04DRAFT_586287 [Polyplosphaeria fusca]
MPPTTNMANEMERYLNPALCANPKCQHSSKKPADIVCQGCKLVQYCCKACQSAHAGLHKKFCKSDLMAEIYVPRWVKEKRTPQFIGYNHREKLGYVSFGGDQFFWGNMPALDILNLQANGGKNTICNTAFLFAASGDMRNVVKTITGLPEAYEDQCTVVVNDRSFPIVARNALLLLIAFHFDQETAVPMMIHLWYSALVPAVMVKQLATHILPLIEDVCIKIKDRKADIIQAKTFKFGNGSLRLALMKEDWTNLKDYFKVPEGLTRDRAEAIRQNITMAPDRADYLDRTMYCMKSAGMRTCLMKFREDGVLLPFSASRNDFDTPNPSFYQTADIWPMRDNANPTGGWSHLEFMKCTPKASNDHTGGLFFYLRTLLIDFCKRMKSANISYQLFNVNATVLPGHLEQSGLGGILFDRIEIKVSNICDRGYLGPESVFATFAPLLKPASQTTKGILLMLYLNAVIEECHSRDGEVEDLHSKTQQAMKFLKNDSPARLRKFRNSIIDTHNPEAVRMSMASAMFLDFKKDFQTFSEKVQMDQLVKKHKLKIRRKHTIVEPWPFKLSAQSTQKEFDLLSASQWSGHERYMEFERDTEVTGVEELAALGEMSLGVN